MQLRWLGGKPCSGWGSSPRKRSCPGNYLPWCIKAASGGVGDAQSVATPQGKRAAGIALHQAGCCAGMGCPRGSTSMCAQKMQGPFGPSERSRKPHDGPQGPFFRLLLSPPLRHLIQAALSARASAGPWPAPSLTVTLCKLGQGTVLESGVVSPWGAPLSLGAAAEHWGGTFGQTLPGTEATSHFSARICRARAAGSALTTHRGQMCWGQEGSHSTCTMYTS